MRQWIGVLLDLDDFNVKPETEHGYASFYIKEILSHAGIPFEVVERADLVSGLDRCRLMILPWDMALEDEEREAIERFVEPVAL